MASIYEQSARLLKAMAHPTRLQILDILSHGEACVCHLTALLEQRQPYVSQQLMLLREASLVADNREGVVIYYRLVDDRAAQIIALTRTMLRQMGIDVEAEAVPEEPLDNCTCPRCEATRVSRQAIA